MDEIYALQQFMLAEMQKRNMSMRQFADLLGVSHSTLSRFLDNRDRTKPSFDMLVSLARITDNPDALAALVFPNLTGKMESSSTAHWVAQNFDDLPEVLQRAIVAIIREAQSQPTPNDSSNG